MRFEGKVAFVTGASRGIGASVARRLIEEGARVVLADNRKQEGEGQAQALGEHAIFVALDVSSPVNWKAAVDRAVEALGGIDILVNNAGIFFLRSLDDTTPEEFERMFRVNQLGTFLGMKSVAPAMRSRGGGVIINMSSTAGLRGYPNTLAYGSTKWAVRGMTRIAASELATDRIRVLSVHPGAVDTPMNRAEIGEAGLASAAQRNPSGRVADEGEIANMVLWLASGEANFCTGAEFVIDGGATAI